MCVCVCVCVCVRVYVCVSEREGECVCVCVRARAVVSRTEKGMMKYDGVKQLMVRERAGREKEELNNTTCTCTRVGELKLDNYGAMIALIGFVSICRSCGGVFCGTCSNYYCPVPHEQLFVDVRVCEKCYYRLDGHLNNRRTPNVSTTPT